MSQGPLLTICIPSYNRGPRVYSLVAYLAGAIAPQLAGGDIEILVANNRSKDDTKARIETLVRPGIRLHTHEVHYPTAEENMFHSLELCEGKFIWFHGDDDLPSREGILLLLEQLRVDAADLYCFNSSRINMEGRFLGERLLPMHAPYIDTTPNKAMQALGITFYLAGVTNVVMRRSMVDKQTALGIYAIQPIYSHVFWILLSFKGAKLRIVNYPLVSYRLSANETVEHFQAYAKKQNIGEHVVWGFGMLKLLKHLVEQGGASPQDVARICDLTAEGTRVRLIDEAVQRMFRQLENATMSTEPREQVSMEMFIEARDFLYTVDLALYDVLRPLEQLCRLANSGKRRPTEVLEACTRFFSRFAAMLPESKYGSVFAGTAYGYGLYHTLTGCVAIAPQRMHMRERILHCLDPFDDLPYVFTGYDRESVILRLETHLQGEKKASVYSAEEQEERYYLSMPHPVGPEPMHVAYEGSDTREMYLRFGEMTDKIAQSLDNLCHLQRHSVEIYRQATFPMRLIWKTIRAVTRIFRRSKA